MNIKDRFKSKNENGGSENNRNSNESNEINSFNSTSYRDMYIEGRNVTKIVKALSNDVRLKILELLENQELNIQELTERLGLGKTTVLTHINILEEAGFISTRYIPGTAGNQKICTKLYDRLIFNFSPGKGDGQKQGFYKVSIPVGNYFDFEIYPPCGLAARDNVIKKWDDPFLFYDIERVKASLVWGAYGYLEYKIPLEQPFKVKNITKVEILMEISALGGVGEHKELLLPAYLDKQRLTDGISDITFWLNEKEIGTYTTREFKRGSGGKYTPTWWKGSNYGELIKITISDEGILLEGEYGKVMCDSGKFIREILTAANSLSLKIGIKKDAVHISGFNIYGSSFGNYPHDILVRFYS